MALSEEARLFADRHRVARLATASAAGEPHVIPLCYAIAGDTLYFVIDEKPKQTHRGLKRLRNIDANPRVALVVDDYADDWTQLAYLMIEGRAGLVADEAEFDQALMLLRQRYPQYVGMPMRFETNPMVRISIERFRLWRAVMPD